MSIKDEGQPMGRDKKAQAEYFAKYYIENRERILRINKEHQQGKGKSVKRKCELASQIRNKFKVNCRVRTRYAVKKGLIKKTLCEICGEVKVEAHHKDYSDHLDVRWLCHYCHRNIEGRIAITTANIATIGIKEDTCG